MNGNEYKEVTEGIRKRNPHKWNQLDPLTKEEKMIEHFLANNNIIKLAKDFETTTTECTTFLESHGII